MYEFSAPMPYTIKDIDKLLDINNNIEKSKITSLYASLPSTCSMFTGFEQPRNTLLGKTNFSYWKNLFYFSLEKGVDFIYLLNNPIPLDINNSCFNNKIEKLDKLLNELNKLGINKLRIANPQLMSYLAKHYRNFIIYASTSLDYKTISEYQNLILMHPEIKQIVPSHDINKNFKLLKNLRCNYTDLDIEIMVNEGCMQGCPHRNLHECLNIDLINKKNYNDLSLSASYCSAFCNYVTDKYLFYRLTLNNNIYPWEIKEYSKIGINKFKLVGRDDFSERMNSYIKEYLLYFKSIDNYNNSKEFPISSYIHYFSQNTKIQSLLTKEVRYLLPQTAHFKKYGHLCASICGVECKYCYKCAEKIQKVFEKKQEEQRKRIIPVCVVNKSNI